MEITGGNQMVKTNADRKQKKTVSVRERVEQNKWNPFERVDPKILERIHKQHEANARRHTLDQAEAATW
jgi:hypothetical protein